MKRSEMIAKLRDHYFAEEVRPENFCGFSNKYIEDFSDSILTFLESQGMQPPPREIESYVAWIENEQVIKSPYSTITNKWEPE